MIKIFSPTDKMFFSNGGVVKQQSQFEKGDEE